MIINKERILPKNMVLQEDITLEDVNDIENKLVEEASICEDIEINTFDELNNTGIEIPEADEMTLDKTSQLLEEQNADEEVFEKKETVETNCLALTVRKDYNISIFKNTVFTTFRITCKVTIFTVILNFLSLLF